MLLHLEAVCLSCVSCGFSCDFFTDLMQPHFGIHHEWPMYHLDVTDCVLNVTRSPGCLPLITLCDRVDTYNLSLEMTHMHDNHVVHVDGVE